MCALLLASGGVIYRYASRKAEPGGSEPSGYGKVPDQFRVQPEPVRLPATEDVPRDRLLISTASLPAAAPPAAEQVRRQVADTADDFIKLAQKYRNRPVAKQFWAEISADPVFQKALQTPDNAGAMLLLAQSQASRNAATVVKKYMGNPDFIRLVQDITRDPDFARAMGRLGPMVGGALSGIPASPYGPVPPGVSAAIQSAVGTLRVDPAELGSNSRPQSARGAPTGE